MVIVLQCSRSDDENQDLKNIDLDLSELDRNDIYPIDKQTDKWSGRKICIHRDCKREK
jgi:hypothetical protein